MLYQLAVYARACPTGEAAILYPTSDTAARVSRIEIKDPWTGHRAGFVDLRPVMLDSLADAIRRRDARELSRIASTLAHLE